MAIKCDIQLIVDRDFFDFITLANIINYIKTFNYLSEARMVSIQMRRIVSAMANKELRPTSISTRMCHAQHSSIVVLIISI